MTSHFFKDEVIPLPEMLRATALRDVHELLGKVLDVEDLNVIVNDSIVNVTYKPLSDICSVEITARKREPHDARTLMAKIRPGETLREDNLPIRQQDHSVLQLFQVWALRVRSERDAIEAMKPLLEQQAREAEWYAKLTQYPDRVRTPEEAGEFREKLALLEERLDQHVAATVKDPGERAKATEAVHGGIQKLERRSALITVRRSMAMLYVFIMSFAKDAATVATLVEHAEKLLKFLGP